MSRESAIVAVFGDLGRSPRMMNHTRELMKLNFEVNVIGYDGGIIFHLNTCSLTISKILTVKLPHLLVLSYTLLILFNLIS